MEAFTFQDLLFRPFADGDLAAFVQAARESAASVGPWMPWCHADYSEQDARDWFAINRHAAEAGTAYDYGVFCAESGAFLAGAGLNQINKLHSVCNLGYWVRSSRQRQGIASRCVQALARRGFEQMGMRRIEIVVALGNDASEAVARRSGALFEGVARNRLRIGDKSVPASMFSLVPE